MLRAAGNAVPILLLTARSDVADCVAGLDAGADDYLSKPFDPNELLARLRAMARRTTHLPASPAGYDDLELVPEAHAVRQNGRWIDLSSTEYAILCVLAENPEQALSRGQISDAVWGYAMTPASNSLEVYISYLRRKLEAEGEPRIIQTVRGVGYRLAAS
jgi:two-component system response regulator MprA